MQRDRHFRPDLIDLRLLYRVHLAQTLQIDITQFDDCKRLVVFTPDPFFLLKIPSNMNGKIKFKFFAHFITELGEFTKQGEKVAEECMKHMNDLHHTEGNNLKESFYFLDRSTKKETRVKVNFSGYDGEFNAQYNELIKSRTPVDTYDEQRRRGRSTGTNMTNDF